MLNVRFDQEMIIEKESKQGLNTDTGDPAQILEN